METAYAQALWIVIEKGTPHAEAVRALHAKLKSEGREALLPRIAKAFERLGLSLNNRNTIVLTVADKAHEHTAIKAVAPELAKLGIDEKDIVVNVDHTLIGGWRLEGHETLVDSSYKKHLLALYAAATQH